VTCIRIMVVLLRGLAPCGIRCGRRSKRGLVADHAPELSLEFTSLLLFRLLLRLLELFEVVGTQDPRVTAARGALARVLF
jgi:hypothetical protein